MKIIGIDPGPENSGMCITGPDGVIKAENISNADIVRWFRMQEEPFYTPLIAIEDIAPYGRPLNQPTIDTCKWIGLLDHLITENGFALKKEIFYITKTEIKYWLYSKCPEYCIPRVIKRMEAIDKREVAKGNKGLRNERGELRKPSFNYVDDRITQGAVKHLLNIPTPKVGKSNIYGLHSHSWQALACAAYLRDKLTTTRPDTPPSEEKPAKTPELQ